MGEPIEETRTPVTRVQLAQICDLGRGQLHDVPDPLPGIDPAQAVVAQSEGGEHGQLRHGLLVFGTFVGEAAEDYFRTVGHGKLFLTRVGACFRAAILKSESLRARNPPSQGCRGELGGKYNCPTT